MADSGCMLGVTTNLAELLYLLFLLQQHRGRGPGLLLSLHHHRQFLDVASSLAGTSEGF